MSNLDIDDESDVETPEVASEHSSDLTSMTSQIDHLRSMKRELDFRGTLLGKTWAELSQLLGKYQSELVTKYDHLDSMLGSEGRDQIIKLENNVESKSRQISQLQTTIHDLETRLLEKDGEIVQLRTDVHKLRNEVSIKDNLINKVQTQMAKESMDYSTEISTLKEIISVGEGAMSQLAPLDTLEIMPPQPKKKRKSMPHVTRDILPSPKSKKDSMKQFVPSTSIGISLQSLQSPPITLAPANITLPPIVLSTPSFLPILPAPDPKPTQNLTNRDFAKNLDLQLEIEEEPSIKSESVDDVMMALEQPADDEPGTSSMSKGYANIACKPRRCGWKPHMTTEERAEYNRAARERMRRYRERKKKDRLDHFINRMSYDKSTNNNNNNNSLEGDLVKKEVHDDWVDNRKNSEQNEALNLVKKKSGVVHDSTEKMSKYRAELEKFVSDNDKTKEGRISEGGNPAIAADSKRRNKREIQDFVRDYKAPADLDLGSLRQIMNRPSMVPPLSPPLILPEAGTKRSMTNKWASYLNDEQPTPMLMLPEAGSKRSKKEKYRSYLCDEQPKPMSIGDSVHAESMGASKATSEDIRSRIMRERIHSRENSGSAVFAEYWSPHQKNIVGSSGILSSDEEFGETSYIEKLKAKKQMDLCGNSTMEDDLTVRDLNRNITHVGKLPNPRIYFP